MIRTLSLGALALGFLALVTTAPQPAQAAGCWQVGASAKGIFEAQVAGRATRKVKRSINRAARKGGYSAHVSPVRTKCHATGSRPRVACAAAARVCR